MAPISEDEFEDLLVYGFEREAVHLETRDAYGTGEELPYMAKWSAGEHDDLSWLDDWCAALRQHAAAGRRVRRARIVSEPLSEYQRWSHSIADPMVEGGEDVENILLRLIQAADLTPRNSAAASSLDSCGMTAASASFASRASSSRSRSI